jgi:hypothetical protein
VIFREAGRGGHYDDNPRLESDLMGPGYELDSTVRIQVDGKKEMKERGVDSPDDADALALTFARRIAEPAPPNQRPRYRPVSRWG